MLKGKNPPLAKRSGEKWNADDDDKADCLARIFPY